MADKDLFAVQLSALQAESERLKAELAKQQRRHEEHVEQLQSSLDVSDKALQAANETIAGQARQLESLAAWLSASVRKTFLSKQFKCPITGYSPAAAASSASLSSPSLPTARLALSSSSSSSSVSLSALATSAEASPDDSTDDDDATLVQTAALKQLRIRKKAGGKPRVEDGPVLLCLTSRGELVWHTGGDTLSVCVRNFVRMAATLSSDDDNDSDSTIECVTGDERALWLCFAQRATCEQWFELLRSASPLLQLAASVSSVDRRSVGAEAAAPQSQSRTDQRFTSSTAQLQLTADDLAALQVGPSGGDERGGALQSIGSLEFQVRDGQCIVYDGVEYRLHELEPFGVNPADSPFDRSFSLNHALWLGHLSHLAYGNNETVRAVCERVLHCSALAFFDDAQYDIHGFGVVLQSGVAVLAFRGTASKANWSVNLDSAKEPMIDEMLAGRDDWATWQKKLLVHSGFKAALLSVWPAVERFLVDVQQRKDSTAVYLTGHSLGGALATVCLLKTLVRRQPLPVHGVMTFGQPRVGNSWLSKFVAAHTPLVVQRVQNSSDLVPNVPASSAGYRHCGAHVFFLSDGRVMHDPSVSQQRREQSLHMSSGIANHSTRSYLRTLQLFQQRLDDAAAVETGRETAERLRYYKVFVTLVRADDLFAADLSGTSDPYAVVRWGEQQQAIRSAIKFKTLSPQWQQVLEIPQLCSAQATVTVDLYDYDRWSKDDFLGRVVLSFTPAMLKQGVVPPAAHPLRPRPGRKRDHYVRGTVTLGFRFFKLAGDGSRRPHAGSGALLTAGFGVSLARQMKLQRQAGGSLGSGLEVPFFVHQAVGYLLREFVAQPAPPADLSDAKRVGALRSQLACGALTSFDDTHAPRDAYLVLLNWLFELPEPLLTFELYESFLSCACSDGPPAFSKPAPARPADMHALCQLLPKTNRLTVVHVLYLMEQRYRNRYFSDATLEQLCDTLGPLLLSARNPATGAKLPIACHARTVACVVRYLLLYYRSLFADLLGDTPPDQRFVCTAAKIHLPALLRFKHLAHYSVSSAARQKHHAITSLHVLTTVVDASCRLVFVTSKLGRYGLFAADQLDLRDAGLLWTGTALPDSLPAAAAGRRQSWLLSPSRGIAFSALLERKHMPPGLPELDACHYVAVLFHFEGPPSLLPIFALDRPTARCGPLQLLHSVATPSGWRAGLYLHAVRRFWILPYDAAPLSFQLPGADAAPMAVTTPACSFDVPAWSGCLAVYVQSRGEIWVSNAADGHCYVFSAADNACTERFVLGSNYELIRTASVTPVKAMVLAVDEQRVFTGGSELCSFSTDSRRLLYSAPTNTSTVVSLHVLNDRGFLVTGHSESEVGIWCSTALTQLACIQLGAGRITAVLPVWIAASRRQPHTDEAPADAYVLKPEMSADDGYYAMWIADSEGRLTVWTSVTAQSTACDLAEPLVSVQPIADASPAALGKQKSGWLKAHRPAFKRKESTS